MEKQIKTRGIVIRRIDLGEADQIITVLSEDQGKISILAKGARRLKSRFSGKIELMADVLVTYFEGRDLGYLNEVESYTLMEERNLDLRSRSLLFYMAEATQKLVADGQECQNIYHKLKKGLSSFEKYSAEPIFYAYLIKVLTELGFMGDWSKCNRTNSKLDLNTPYFVSSHDGNLTKDASLSFSGIPLTPTIIKWINYMQKEDFDQLKNIRSTKNEQMEVFFVLKSILETIINHPFKSEAFLKLV